MTICAYCKQKALLTREHIVPSFLYSFQKELEKKTVGWNEVVQKMVGGEGTVRDVCASCNSGTLSDLDAYGKRLLLRSDVLVENYQKSTVSLSYDYSLLLRWLLKISFNSSRTDGAHSYLFEPHIPFILGKQAPPPRSRICLIAYMAAPEAYDLSTLKESFLKLSGGSKILNPFHVRISYGATTRAYSPYTLRIVILGCLVFFILLFDQSIKPGHAAVEIRRFMKNLSNTCELLPNVKKVVLKSGKMTWFQLYHAQIVRSKGF